MHQAASPLRDGTRCVGKCPLPHAPISQGGGPREVVVHSNSPPKLGHPKGQGCWEPGRGRPPLGWMLSRSSVLGSSTPATSVTGVSINRIGEVWIACSSSAGWKVEFPLSQGLQDFETWFRLEQNPKLLKFSTKEN